MSRVGRPALRLHDLLKARGCSGGQVGRSDLEAWLCAGTPNDRSGGGHLETQRDRSG
jgi:hypothetical protein